MKDAKQKPPVQSWDNLILTCRFLADLRELRQGRLERILGLLPLFSQALLLQRANRCGKYCSC